MANRYWRLMGYAETDTTETIDLCDYMNLSEEDVEELSQEEVQKDLDNDAWQTAIEKVEAFAEPITEDEME